MPADSFKFNGSVYIPSTQYKLYCNVDGIPLNGFPDKTTSTIYISGTTLFNIAPVSGSFYYFSSGGKYYVSATQSLTLSSATIGLKIVFYDDATLTEYSSLPDPINAITAAVYWNGTEAMLLEERHGFYMDQDTHTYLHNSRGSVLGNPSNFGITYTLSATAGTTLSATISLATGVLRDEDNRITVTDGYDGWYGQTLSPTARIPVIIRKSIVYNAVTVSPWFRSAATELPVTTGTLSDHICYNRYVDAATGWTLSQTSLNYHVAYWILCTNIAGSPIISIPGQREDLTLTDAKANNTLANLDLTGLPTVEFRVLYRLIYKYSAGYANIAKADIIEVEDYRNQGAAPSGTIQTVIHNSLAGRSESDAHPAAAISTDTTNFNGILTTSSTNVQLALEEIDDHTHTSFNNLTITTATITSTLTVAGNYVAYDNHNHDINSTVATIGSLFSQALESNNTYNGFIITATAGTTLSQWDVCLLASDGKFDPVDADNETDIKGLLAISSTSAVDADNINFILRGFVRNDSWNWAVGSVLYLDTATAGAMSQTASTISGDFIRVLGWAFNSDIIYFNPSNDYLEVG